MKPPPDPQLRRVASISNLELAWLRLRTSSERKYRDYFRPLYRAFGLASDTHLETLSKALLGGYYEPSTTTKIFVPKPSGLQRVFTLLSVEDQIAYQAIANVVADRLYSRNKSRYNRNVFGHVYAGPSSPFFYRDWKRSYSSFSNAMRRAFNDGYVETASFDLTACYDSIDHDVLKHFLLRLNLSDEVSSLLCRMLRHWTDSSPRKPIYHGHGIPQGPLGSGMIAEVVLGHFDSTANTKGIRYFRYVDDIRLFARNDYALRRELFSLDIKSKQIGLFPQSSKVSIHRVTRIEDELKGISLPAIGFPPPSGPEQERIRKQLVKLSPRFRINDSTQFKYYLGGAAPNTSLALRLLRILGHDPSLYEAIGRYLSRCPNLSKKVSTHVLDVLKSHDLYPGFASGLLRAIRENLHRDVLPRCFTYCRSRLYGRRSSKSPEVRAAAGAVLLWHRQLTWQQSRELIVSSPSSWMRAWLPGFLHPDHIGLPSYETIITDLMRDEAVDPALVGVELFVTHKLAVPRAVSSFNPAAQLTLREVGKIGRIRTKACPIRAKMIKTLSPKIGVVNWRKVFDARTYQLMIHRVSVWSSYANTDSTAWIVLTDTINDILLNALFGHDPTVGSYRLGKIGSVLQPTSRFAQQYPRLYKVVREVHEMRLRADLAHPVTRTTNSPTHRIPYREMRRLLRPLEVGYIELWEKW
jgi:hypothetical protein